MLKKIISSFGCCLFSLHATHHVVDSMTVEEKVGQLLMVHFHGEEANENASKVIEKLHVGGIICYQWSNGMKNPQQIRQMTAGLQAMALKRSQGIPLLIATDQEGGVVARCKSGFTLFPGNRALGIVGDEALTFAAAQAMGAELIDVGINYNLAPVVDINSNPRNPVIGIRSFGSCTDLVVRLGRAALQGFRQGGVLTALKHFPGHGDVDIDSHIELPVLRKTKAQLQATELVPFAQLAQEADTIMTAHILIPALDASRCATLSPQINAILRNDLGFKGVVITDSLVMAGVLKNAGSIEQAALQALNAGCDILLLGGKQIIDGHLEELVFKDFEKIRDHLVTAVQNGEIEKTRLDEAVSRILTLKAKIHNQTTHAQRHDILAQQIAAAALRVEHPEKINEILNMDSKIVLLAPQALCEAVQPIAAAFAQKVCFFENLNESCACLDAFDSCIFVSNNGWKSQQQLQLFQTMQALGKKIILVIARDSLDLEIFTGADVVIETFSPSLPSFQAVHDLLQKAML